VTIVAGGSCSITASQAGNATYGAATPVTRGFTVGSASQSVTFGALSGVTYGVSPFTIAATASSGLAVSFVSSTTSVCTVTGNTVTIVAGGSCSITASQAGDASHGAATPVAQSFTVNPAPQTIAFGALGNVSFGVAPFTIGATASSGLAVSYASTTTSVCTVAGNAVAILALGSCSITATQTGNGNFAAATPVAQSFTVSSASQTIAFGALSGVTYGVSPFTIAATASSGLAVSFVSSTTSVCTVTGNTVTIVAGGSCSITASQAGDATHGAATPVAQSFTVNPASQSVTFGALSGVTYGVSPFMIGATASSGLAVSFASTTTSVCTVSGSTVTIVAGGSCSITASQAGNASYGAATPVAQSFTVNPAPQTIAFGALGNVSFGIAPFMIVATASSGLALSFASTTTSVCTVAGSAVAILALGSCSITAGQAGNGNYAAATPVAQSFTVSSASQTIAFGALSDVTYGVSPFTIAATASSGLAVSFVSSTTPICTVTGNTVTIVAGGGCSITASQAGDATHGAATPVAQSFTVNPAPQTIAFGTLSDVTYGASPFTIAATASSGLAVSFVSSTTSVCTVSGSTVTIVAGGSCSITASQAGDASHGAATSVTRGFTVGSASQTIAFSALSGVTYGVSPFTIAATASSGLAVSFVSSTTSVCTVTGSTVTIVAGGSCSITASQAGDASHGAATPVAQSFTVNPAPQTIAFGALGNVSFGVAPFMIGATASSGLAVSYASTTTSVCTVAGNAVAILALGSCSITASQTGNGNFAAATPVAQSFTVSSASQTIAFGALSDVTYGVSPFTIAATASSGLAVSFVSSTAPVCTVSGSTVTIVAGGGCSITASQAGDASHGAATPVAQSFTVSSASQTIAFSALSGVTYGVSPFTIAATASSGLAVSFVSSTTPVCTVSGSTVTIVAGGGCSITASQAGNASYAAATPVAQSFTVNSASQTIAFSALSGVTYGASPFTIAATASSGLAVSFVSSTTSVCTVTGSTVTIVAGGSCSITASQAGDASHGAATPVAQSFTVNPAPQTIAFGALGNVSFGVAPFTIVATASSGLAVSYASTTTSVCTVAGSAVAILALGSCSITASQAGNGNYAAATPVTQSFTANSASQTIAFGALSDVTYGVSPFTIAATASSGLAVSFVSSTAPVCTVSGSTVTIVAGGGCSITASQAGDATYGAATPVTRSFTVGSGIADRSPSERVERRDLRRVAIHHRSHGEFGAGGEFRFHHDIGLHGFREHGGDCRRGWLFDHGEPGGGRQPWGGDAGDAEFHGQFSIAVGHLWSAERGDVWRVAIYHHSHGELGPGGEFRFHHDLGLYSDREHCGGCHWGRMFDHGEPGG
jgi:hypothetical protein